MKNTLNVENMMEPDFLAREITNRWVTWNSARQSWLEEKKELRNYVFATDTRTTSNKTLPWANSTTTPKLTQIYDNLKANYSAALFPTRKWMRWEGETKDSNMPSKKRVVQEYMYNKLQKGGFERTADTLIDDFILYGNCFGTVEYEANYSEVDGVPVPNFIGPKVTRISPYDIVFDPTAATFKDSPKIIRSLMSLGEMTKLLSSHPEYATVLKRMKSNRSAVNSADVTTKDEGYIADGFASMSVYYNSGYVEVMTFYGDLFDSQTGEFKENRKIVIVDRAYIIYDEPIASWLGQDPVFHASWRSRPDNLYGMGPLDNLVGMQYRIDHLENLKADVFDQIALPTIVVQGDVADFNFAPGERIYVGEEGNVQFLRPDATALQADLQIQLIENKMEELAGAPRQAMGIRTPGEKTAFEVQQLENSASRIFQHKAAKFEREFIEPILNAMLESARRNMDTSDLIRALDDETGANLFLTVTREDIAASGRLVPVGARHFAERAQRVQNITQMLQIKTVPDVGVHLSGKEIAKLVAEELGEEKLYGDNIAVREQMETQSIAQDEEASMLEKQQIAAEVGL